MPAQPVIAKLEEIDAAVSADRPDGMTAAEDEAATADDDSAGEAVDEARLDESWSNAASSAGYGWRSAHWQSS